VILGIGMTSVRLDGEDLAVELADGQELRPDALLFAAADVWRGVSATCVHLEIHDRSADVSRSAEMTFAVDLACQVPHFGARYRGRAADKRSKGLTAVSRRSGL
jgi:hypothetical protein